MKLLAEYQRHKRFTLSKASFCYLTPLESVKLRGGVPAPQTVYPFKSVEVLPDPLESPQFFPDPWKSVKLLAEYQRHKRFTLSKASICYLTPLESIKLRGGVPAPQEVNPFKSVNCFSDAYGIMSMGKKG